MTQASMDIDDHALLSLLIERCSHLLEATTVFTYFGSNRKQLQDLLETIRMKEHTYQVPSTAVPPQNYCSDQFKDISLWLSEKEKEIKILERFFLTIKKNEHIIVTASTSNQCKVDNFTSDSESNYGRVVCLKILIPSCHKTNTNRTEEILTSANGSVNGTTEIEDDSNLSIELLWYKDKKQLRHIRKQIRQFVSFANANRKDDVKFVALFGEGDECTSSITLCRDGQTLEDFDPPVSPEYVKPVKSGITHSSILLEWSKPEYGSDSVQKYTVCYGLKEEPADQWKSKTTTGKETSLTLGNLRSESEYLFKVRAEYDAGVSEYSHLSDPIVTLQTPPSHLSDLLKHTSVLPHSDARLPVYLIHTNGDFMQEGIRHVTIGKQTKCVENKVLMVLGATGTGKSTLINGMINYILGVQWKDDFRFKLITDEGKSQAHSQANHITVYTIHAMPGSPLPYSLTIIDTPGFEDTSGFEQDLLIMEKIKLFFTSKSVPYLNGVGLVVQSALMRLTTTQKYVFDSLLSIFGKNVAQNIFIMITFADGQTPPVMTAIREAKIPHADIFRFNNSALYAIGSTDDDNFDEMFWKMGMESFKKFFTLFSDTKNVDLNTTRRVLEERDKVLTLALEFQQLLEECLTEIEFVKQNKTLLLTIEAELSSSKVYSETQEVQLEYQKTDTETAVWKQKITFPELKQQYKSALVRKVTVEKELVTYQRKLQGARVELKSVATRASECLLTLKDIALNPFPFTRVSYVQLLIEMEQREAREGWEHRVSFMEAVKERVKILSCIRYNINFDSIDQEQIEQLKKDKQEEIVEVLEKLRRVVNS